MVDTLVTSSIESTWPRKGKVIFLGIWCCLFDRKEQWSKLEYCIEDYHWDDRRKLSDDYYQLEKIYESYLLDFSLYLNKIHNQEFSERFWRILIGPWLYSTINILYDRWFMLLKVVSEQKNLRKIILKDISDSLRVSNMNDFNKKIEEDEWNEA